MYRRRHHTARGPLEQRRRHVAERTVRSNGVVVITLSRTVRRRISEFEEPMLFQTAVPKTPVEALNERILIRFARLDEVQLHAVLSTPEEHRLTRHLRTVRSAV